ncbi:arginase family protein [Aureimonas mangrovi]|uniref:arginase family protein n=1 Tax=Aureimonas mangrovi TaxID=2758041 RepID=UPI00163DCE45|nr:arginase family protein [Aureimonas mangrovi]
MRTSMRGAEGRLNRGFVGIPTFCRADYCSDPEALDARFAVIGVPFDEGSPFAPGSRFAPRSIREHSLRFGHRGIVDVETGATHLGDLVPSGALVDLGDADVVPSSAARTFANLTRTVETVRARGAMPIVLGGDHATSFPVVRGFSEPIHVVQLDAHIDYGTYDDEFRYGNGQGFRQIHELPQVASLTQIGIRSLRTNPADLRQARDAGSRIVTMDMLRARPLADALDHIPAGAPCYLSIDIDAYDMPLVPGCVSAEPDGLTFQMMRELLRAIGSRLDVKGLDLVEVNPTLDVGTGITSYLAALTVLLALKEGPLRH